MTKAVSLVMFDTNILVNVLRASPIGRKAFDDALQINAAERPLISVVTVGEMHSLAKQLSWGRKRVDTLDELLRNLVIVDINSGPIISRYAEIDAWSRTQGHRMGKNDVWIAATASMTGAMLMTTDGDFDHLHPVYLTRTVYNADGTRR